jgi:cytochrome c-type biogenesis protein CcmH
MSIMRGLVLFALLMCAAPFVVQHALAVQPGEELADKGQERRAREISAGLRCLVCQNQTIDDSDAPLAKDLRRIVRERISAGDSDAAVHAFVVARYGEFVLMKPPFGLHTALLWIGPFLVLLAGAGGLLLWRRKSIGVAIDAEPLSDAERERVENIVKGE